MEVVLSYLTEKLIKSDDVDFDSSTCKGLAGRATREATVFFEPLLVLRNVSSLPEFSKLGHKFCSVAVLTFLEDTKDGGTLSPTAGSLSAAAPVEEDKGGDIDDEHNDARAIVPTSTATPTVPDSVVAKAWVWIKTTSELKKVRTLAAACNAIAFLCRCRGYGLVWGDEVEVEVEAVLKEALEDVKTTRNKETAAADATGWTSSQNSQCAKLVATSFDGTPQVLQTMLEDELARQYKLRAEQNPNAKIHVSRSSSTTTSSSFDVTAVLVSPADKTSSEATLARALTNALQDRAGAGSSPLATLQARLHAAVETLRHSTSTSYRFSEVLYPASATREVYTSKIIGCFIGKGGANIKKLKADLEALHPQVDMFLSDGVVTVTVECKSGTLKPELCTLLSRAVAAAKVKATNPYAMRRGPRFRSSVRLPHLIQLGSPCDYVWSKKAARMQRYNSERKARKAYAAPKFKGVVQDFDMGPKTLMQFQSKRRKERDVSRCATKRQERRAREAKIEKRASKKRSTKCRSRAHSSKLSCDNDFVVGF